MTAGRPRKPTALALLHGDDKVHPERFNRREPRPTGEAIPPPWLTAAARELWDQLAPWMTKVGTLTAIDGPLFAEFCEVMVLARFARGRAALEIAGRLPIVAGGSSASASWARAIHIAASLGGRFGMTPADRARISVGGDYHDEGSDLLT